MTSLLLQDWLLDILLLLLNSLLHSLHVPLYDSWNILLLHGILHRVNTTLIDVLLLHHLLILLLVLNSGHSRHGLLLRCHIEVRWLSQLGNQGRVLLWLVRILLRLVLRDHRVLRHVPRHHLTTSLHASLIAESLIGHEGLPVLIRGIPSLIRVLLLRVGRALWEIALWVGRSEISLWISHLVHRLLLLLLLRVCNLHHLRC